MRAGGLRDMVGAVHNATSPPDFLTTPLKHIWLCILQELGCLCPRAADWLVQVIRPCPLPCRLLTPAYSGTQRQTQNPARAKDCSFPPAWLVGGDLPPVSSGTSWNADSIALLGWSNTELCFLPSSVVASSLPGPSL